MTTINITLTAHTLKTHFSRSRSVATLADGSTLSYASGRFEHNYEPISDDMAVARANGLPQVVLLRLLAKQAEWEQERVEAEAALSELISLLQTAGGLVQIDSESVLRLIPASQYRGASVERITYGYDYDRYEHEEYSEEVTPQSVFCVLDEIKEVLPTMKDAEEYGRRLLDASESLAESKQTLSDMVARRRLLEAELQVLKDQIEAVCASPDDVIKMHLRSAAGLCPVIER